MISCASYDAHLFKIISMYEYNNIKFRSNFEQSSRGKEIKDINIHWIDIQKLALEDNDNFTKSDFIFYGNRQLRKKWWFLFIPFINLVVIIQGLIYLLTAPIRLNKNNKQLRKLHSNANDIEDVNKLYRIIRNNQGLLGLCMWGKNFEFKRKIILQPVYVRIIRCNDDTFVITNQDKKMGLYNSMNGTWILPCIMII